MITATRNQLANITNPYQTEAKRVLCVCSAGLLRSPTMANTLHQEYGYNTRACGSNEEFALIPISVALMCWADEIVFVDRDNYNNTHREEGYAHIIKNKRVVVLDIPDQFSWNQEELVEIIKEQYKESGNESVYR